MLFFLYGADTYRSKKKLAEITARYKAIHRSGLGLHILEGEGGRFEVFRNIATTIPMFQEKKLIVLTEAIGNREFSDAFLLGSERVALKDSRDSIVVFWEKEIDEKNPMAAWLCKNAQVQKFEPLSGARLKQWAERFLAQEGIAMSQAALFSLLARVPQGDLWFFTNELKKLKAFKGRGEITLSDVNVFAPPDCKTNIFSLVDAFSEGDSSKAARFLHNHRESGENAQYIFTMIHHQFRNIASAQELFERGENNAAQVARLCRLHPYVAKKSIAQARRLGGEKIQKIYQQLMELEKDVKTGQIDAFSALESIIYFV